MKRAVFLYDRSGTMAEPFVKAGWSCVCIDNEGPAGVVGKVVHIRRDARELEAWARGYLPGVGFFAAFPPCDHLAVSGARWFRGGRGCASWPRASNCSRSPPSGPRCPALRT